MKNLSKIVLCLSFCFGGLSVFAQEGLYVKPSYNLQKCLFKMNRIKTEMHADGNYSTRLHHNSSIPPSGFLGDLALSVEWQMAKQRFELGVGMHHMLTGYNTKLRGQEGSGERLSGQEALGVSLNYAREFKSFSFPNGYRLSVEGLSGLTYLSNFYNTPHNRFVTESSLYKLSFVQRSNRYGLGLTLGVGTRLYNKRNKPVVEFRMEYTQGLRPLAFMDIKLTTPDGKVQEATSISRGSGFKLSVGVPIRLWAPKVKK